MSNQGKLHEFTKRIKGTTFPEKRSDERGEGFQNSVGDREG